MMKCGLFFVAGIILATHTSTLQAYSFCPTRKVVTYNTALIDSPLSPKIPPNRLERRQAIIEELRRLNADVVCLQEVWIGHDVEAIVQGVSDVYGYSYSKLHKGGTLPYQHRPMKPACDFMAMTHLAHCASTRRCLKFKNMGKIYACLLRHCIMVFARLSQECVSCIIASDLSITTVFQKCAGNGLPALGMRNMNEPGLLLLSKTRIYNASYSDFHPYTKEVFERGFLDTIVGGFGKVVCTHTTHHLPRYFEPDLSVKGVFGSYYEQSDSEIEELIQKFRMSTPLILMGDFNVGDMFTTAVEPNAPHAYQALVSVFNSVPSDLCTFCPPLENPYQVASSAHLNTVIDHIFHRGHAVVRVDRVFTPFEATLLNGLPLSNHFGIMVMLESC